MLNAGLHLADLLTTLQSTPEQEANPFAAALWRGGGPGTLVVLKLVAVVFTAVCTLQIKRLSYAVPKRHGGVMRTVAVASVCGQNLVMVGIVLNNARVLGIL